MQYFFVRKALLIKSKLESCRLSSMYMLQVSIGLQMKRTIQEAEGCATVGVWRDYPMHEVSNETFRDHMRAGFEANFCMYTSFPKPFRRD